MSKCIQWENKGGVGVLTLNRPDKHNALNVDLLAELTDKIAECEGDKETKVVLLRGAGKSFCAGGDLKGHPFFLPSTSIADREGYIRQAQKVTLGLHRLTQPVIAAVHGLAGGAGMDLAMACDIRIAADDARFGVFFTRAGLMNDMGGTYFLPRLVGIAKALELMFTGDAIDATEALRIGLANQVVARAELEEASLKFAIRLANGPLLANRYAKATVYRNLSLPLEAALDQEVLGQNLLAESDDVREGIAAFQEGRKPKFKGS